MALYEWLMILGSPLCTAVGYLFWVVDRSSWVKNKQLLARCEAQNTLALQGEPAGFYGDYPPAMGPFVPRPVEVKKKKDNPAQRIEKILKAPPSPLAIRIPPINLSPEMVTALREHLVRRPEDYQRLVDRWGTSWIEFQCWECKKVFPGPAGRCPACVEQYRKHYTTTRANQFYPVTEAASLPQALLGVPFHGVAIEQEEFEKTRILDAKQLIAMGQVPGAVFEFAPPLRFLPPTGVRPELLAAHLTRPPLLDTSPSYGKRRTVAPRPSGPNR